MSECVIAYRMLNETHASVLTVDCTNFFFVQIETHSYHKHLFSFVLYVLCLLLNYPRLQYRMTVEKNTQLSETIRFCIHFQLQYSLFRRIMIQLCTLASTDDHNDNDDKRKKMMTVKTENKTCGVTANIS